MVGTLLGFDDFVNMVLDDVVEYESTSEGRRGRERDILQFPIQNKNYNR